MIYLGERRTFEEFGAWSLAPRMVWPRGSIVLSGEPRENRRQLRREAPRAPGVYGMIDSDGELIYVGQSKSLRDRLLSYFGAAAPPKARRIAANARRLVWEAAPDELAALLRELELIRRWRPRYNVRGQPGGRRPTYLVLSRGPGAHVYLAAVPNKGDNRVFGPVRGGRENRRAVHALNDHFRLCTCGRQTPLRRAGQGELFPVAEEVRCMRRELGNCAVRCESPIASLQYADRVRAAKNFLCGSDLSPLLHLEEAMRLAAAAQHYEEASVYRDIWNALHGIHAQLERYRIAQREYSFIYPLRQARGRRLWYFVRGGRVERVIREPHGPRAAERARARIDGIFARRAASVEQSAKEDVEMTLLVAGWFAARPQELQQTLSLPEARERLIAG